MPTTKKPGVLLRVRGSAYGLYKSVWLFPVVLAFIVILLTCLKISQSSIGQYQTFLYGKPNSSSLLINKPRPTRSDEWLVTTQLTIAQKNNHFARFNKNVGNGEDMSVLTDVPYKDWSEIFKPHNLVFFALPLDYAFAFKWWLLSYLLIISCYFFILALLPNRRLFAAGLSLALLASAFIQWWYQYITLAPIYYSLFIATAFMHLMRQQSLKKTVLWGLLLCYLLISFVLILYPPFQIPCAIALDAFILGYLMERIPEQTRRVLLKKLAVVVAALFVAGIISFTFIATRSSTIKTIDHTAYPGNRTIVGGKYDLAHLFSGHLGFQMQFSGKAALYTLPQQGILNQSEASNFILLLLFLFLPSLYLLYKTYTKQKKIDWPLAIVNAIFLLFLLRMFTAAFDWFFRLILLTKVPENRLLIGFGLLNILQIVLVARNLASHKKQSFGQVTVVIYALVVFVAELTLALIAHYRFPGFISISRCIAFSLPVPFIVYFFLRKRFAVATIILLIFSALTSIGVQPLYRGTAILTNTALSRDIRQLSSQVPGKWVVDSIVFENFPVMNNVPSLSGVYVYPQLNLWKPLDNGQDQSVYNRYAHVVFNFDKVGVSEPARLVLPGGLDNFKIETGTCSNFLKQNSVKFILSTNTLQDSCISLVKTEFYPNLSLYIYEIH